MQTGSVLVTIGATIGVVGGITIIIGDPNFTTAGSIIGLLGLAICIGGYAKAMSDDQKELDRQREGNRLGQDIITEIKSMNTNISNLVNEMRLDRKQRKRELEKIENRMNKEH